MVWFSEILRTSFPTLLSEIEHVLLKEKIHYSLLSGTKDIWCRDYLPVSDGTGDFVQFVFDPRYLKYKKYFHLRTDPFLLHDQLKLKPKTCSLILDGGNVVRYGEKMIVTDFVLMDNPDKTEKNIVYELCTILNVHKVIIIPHQSYDFTGHADGMVRLIDEQRVLVNDFSREKEKFKTKLMNSLVRGGLIPITFPYGLNYNSPHTRSAKGTYINFLKAQNIILFPVFGLENDSEAISSVEKFYPHCRIFPINCSELAEEGGVLNCIGWNC